MGLIIAVLCGFVLLIIFATISAKQQNKKITEFLNNVKGELEKQKFIIDKEVSNETNCLYIDNHNKKICFCFLNTQKYKILKFKDIIKFDVVEDNESITKGRAGSAVIGGVLFGGLGALAGASKSKKNKTTCTRLLINIFINDLDDSIIKVVFISKETIKTSLDFKSACEKLDKFVSVLNYIISQNEENKKIRKQKTEE